MQHGSRRADVAVAVCLALGTVALNVRALTADSFLLDDLRFIFSNPLVIDRVSVPARELLQTTRLGHPTPLLVASWSAIREAGGLHVPVLHLVNVLTHAVTVVLLFLLARDWGMRRLPAAGGAALLAAHPATAEPVAWMTQLGVLAAAVPAIAFFWALRRWSRSDSATAGMWAVLAGAAFVLAVGFHPGVVALALLVPWVAWTSPRPPAAQPVVVLSGVCLAFAVGAAMSALRVHTTHGWIVADATLGDRLFTVVALADVHARNVVFPWELLGWYDRPAPSIGVAVRGAVALLVGGACLGVAAFHPRTRTTAIGAGAAFAALAYAPRAGIPVADIRFAAESHVYLPLIGLCLAAAGAFDALGRHAQGRHRPLGVLLAAVLVLLAAGHVAHQAIYRDARAFWLPVQQRDPFHPQAGWALGFADLIAADGTEIWTRDALVPAIGWWARANLYHDPKHDRLLSLDPKALTQPVREVLDRLDEPMAASCARGLDASSSAEDFRHCFSLVRDLPTRRALDAELDIDPL